MRLPRPHIPLEVRCRVAARQLAMPEPVRHDGEGWRDVLDGLLEMLSILLRCPVSDLRLDHNPALGARAKVEDENGKHVDYIPRANDPDHLVYQTKHAHEIKTNVRGDGAQHPDRVLIKRERRRQRPKSKRGRGWPKGRKLQGRSSFPKGRKFPKRRKQP